MVLAAPVRLCMTDEHRQREATLNSFKAILIALSFALVVPISDANAQVAHRGVTPLHEIPPGQWIEKVVDDMDKPGQPFVIRIQGQRHEDTPGLLFSPPFRKAAGRQSTPILPRSLLMNGGLLQGTGLAS